MVKSGVQVVEILEIEIQAEGLIREGEIEIIGMELGI